MDHSIIYRRSSASPNPSHLIRHQGSSSTGQQPSRQRPVSSSTNPTQPSSGPANSTGQSSENQQNISSKHSISQINQLPPLLTSSSPHDVLPPAIRSTLVDVVVEGMGGGNESGQGWQVPPELVFFLRSLGERLDPFSPTNPQNRSSSVSGSVAHTKSLTAALNHATLRPNTDQRALQALFTELVATEKTYLKRINALNQSYAIPLRQFSKSSSTKIIDKYEATSMFGKIEYIVKANQSLLPVLEACLKSLIEGRTDWSDRLCEELEKIQKPYRDYLAGYDSIKDTEQRLLKKSEGFRQFCERTKEAMYDDGMGRKMSSDDPARANLLSCISTCNWIAVCELDSHLIKAATMWGLSRSIEHFPAILVKHGRYFIDSIDVLDIIPDTPSPSALHCTLFLFNDTIVIAKKPANGHLSGKVLAGLDDLDRLVAAMKKSKSTTSSLNSVVSGGTDFLAKSLGGSSHHSTPTKLKKGSMRFKGMVDVHDVIVTNEPGQVTAGGASEVSFDLYLDRTPQDVSERWSDRPHRHYVVCPPPIPPLLVGHERSHSLSSHPASSASHLHHQQSHSLSSKLSHQGSISSQIIACLAERDRFLDNLRRSQALVKAADDRSTVMRTKFLQDTDGPAGVIDSFWNLYDKQTYILEQRKHKVVLQLVGTDVVDPLQFNPEPMDVSLPPLMIIRANFNDPDDPDCIVKVRWKPNYSFPHISYVPRDDRLGNELEEEIVVSAANLNSLIVRIIESFRIADPPPPRSIGNQIFNGSSQQQQIYGSNYPPTSPSRGFRNKSGSLTEVGPGLPHRLFGSHHGNSNINRAKSVTSQASAASTSSRSNPLALRQTNASNTRSPGGPVWYRNGLGSMGVMPEEDEDRTAIIEPKAEVKAIKNSESNPSLYDGSGPGEESSSPLGDTLKGRGIKRNKVKDTNSEEENERDHWAFDSESRSSVSGLSSCDEGDEDEYERRELRDNCGRDRKFETEELERRTTKRSLIGPRQIRQSVSPVATTPTRAQSEPPDQKENQPIDLIGKRHWLPASKPESQRNQSESRKVSGSSIGKRSRSVDSFQERKLNDEESERIKRVAGTDGSGRISPLVVKRKSTTATNLNKGNCGDDRQSSNERRREERRILNNRKSNLKSTDPISKVRDNSGKSKEVDQTIHSDNIHELLMEEVEGNNDLVKKKQKKQQFYVCDMKEKIKRLRSDLKKMRSLVDSMCNERHQASANQNNNQGYSDNLKVGGPMHSSSIPRSPRKLQLSKVANQSGPSNQIGRDGESKENIIKRNKLMETIEGGLEGLNQDLTTVENKNDKIINIEENKVLKTLKDSLEAENNQLYEAFNEELDKMYKDVLLPPGEAINSLIEELKKVSEERGKLITMLGSTKRKLELEVAKSECFEQMLRDSSLLT
ncbi:hypothetical protein PPACK8108_LOCUS22423 [Phakopsora pachyrhizi]|uniref:DH domain-containing protein n=1 Tax=Phakopsora pachyrhizi TaxID=170000 RepID=A0AAV0BJX0_PHAPC|nr:hypothetical protein PPACK8108_LOCUS22423 [Phakopsora pachyrhizi]